MVEHVEGFSTKLPGEPVCQFRVLYKSKIRLDVIGTAPIVAWAGAIGKPLCGERIRVGLIGVGPMAPPRTNAKDPVPSQAC